MGSINLDAYIYTYNMYASVCGNRQGLSSSLPMYEGIFCILLKNVHEKFLTYDEQKTACLMRSVWGIPTYLI